MPELTSPIPLEKCPFRGCNRPGKLYRFKEPGNPNNLGYTYYQVVCDNPPEKDHRGCRHRDLIAAVEEWNGEDGIAGHFSPGNKQGGKKQLPTTGDKVKEGVIVLIILLAFAGTVGGLFIKEWFSAFLCFVIMIMEYKEYKKLDNRKDVPFKEGKIKCGVKPDTGKPTPTEPPPGADGKHPLPVKPKEITQFNGGTNRPPTKPKSNRPPPATEPRNKEKDEPKLLKNIVSFKDIDGNYHYYRIDHFVSLSIPVKGNDLKVTFILVGDVMSYFYVDKPTGEHILQLFEEWSK